jgi:hypothetical protein
MEDVGVSLGSIHRSNEFDPAQRCTQGGGGAGVGKSSWEADSSDTETDVYPVCLRPERDMVL